MTDRNANRPGYQKTRVGWIPEEWEVVHLRDISEINTDSLSSSTLGNYSFSYISLSDVKNGVIQKTLSQMSFSDAPSRARRIIHKGDILLATVRPNLKGFAYINFIPKDMICSTGFAVISPKKNVDGRFLFHYIFSDEVQRYFYACTVGSNYPAINNSDVENMRIPRPKLVEQKKIAEILSTWDRAIEQTQKLIEAKQQLKKGLMQQLLTGRMRFPGFGAPVEKAGELPEGWKKEEFMNLSKVSDEKFTYSDKSIFDRCIELEHIEPNSGQIKGCTDPKQQLSSKNIFHSNDVLFGKLRPYLRKFFFPNFNGVCSSEIWVLKAKSIVIPYYLYLLIQTDRFMAAATQTTGTKMPRADWDVISRQTFTVPEINEQSRIAELLIAIDIQISKLKQRNDFYIQQKKGLMNGLLSGFIRVKSGSELS